MRAAGSVGMGGGEGGRVFKDSRRPGAGLGGGRATRQAWTGSATAVFTTSCGWRRRSDALMRAVDELSERMGRNAVGFSRICQAWAANDLGGKLIHGVLMGIVPSSPVGERRMPEPSAADRCPHIPGLQRNACPPATGKTK